MGFAMIQSRNLSDLHPAVRARAEKFLAQCKSEGIDLLVTCTYRDIEAQNKLYAQGRTTKGARVTNAKGGQSIHQYRCALDVVPMRNGKPVWGTTGVDGALWKRVGMIGKACGLEWAGDWKSFKEYPHFQYTGGYSIEQLRSGRVPK